MAVTVEDVTVARNEDNAFTKNSVSKVEKRKTAEPPLYHDHAGVHRTPVEKRSPYWQPVDDQS